MSMVGITALRPLTHRACTSPAAWSRAHRPDLTQVLLALLVAHQAGLPGLLKPRSGHSRDAPEFGQVIKAPRTQLHTTSGATSLVAARAL
jgi:transposase